MITDEAVEQYKRVNLSKAWRVDAKWNLANQTLIIDYSPSEGNVEWPWLEIKQLVNFDSDVIPASAAALRDRDAVALIFRSSEENQLCRSRSTDGDIFEFGILTSDGYRSNIEGE